ncbi:Isochorismatase hydrolase [Aureobasidium pullulans]|nr:Isochorismatase hydrolase [Aureobasidium pullulans]
MATNTTTFNPSDPSNPAHYSPSQTALLLLDFHTTFLKALGPSSSPAVTTAANLRKWAKYQNIHVIHCLVDTSNPPSFSTCCCIYGRSLDAGEPASLVENVDGDGGEEVTFIRPACYGSALKSPGLLQYLQKNGIKSLILAGISSAGVVLRTALAAKDEEFVVTVVEDGCAEFNEEVHEVLMRDVLPARAYVVRAGTFMEGYERARGCDSEQEDVLLLQL